MSFDYEKERREALDAGERALSSLRAARKELNSASKWGVVDIFGGGLFTDIMKHSKMNNAERYMSQAKYDLQSFGRELQDVAAYVDLDFNTADFLHFADYFLDGFLADWLMQGRINNARTQVEDAIQKVESILRRL